MAEVKPGPHIVFSAHVHNDRGLAIANSMAAIEAGARQVECSIRGVGERAGNAQLEAVILNIMMSGDTPFTCNIDRTQLIPTAKLHAAFVPDISVMLPVSGANAFAHGSGIHQDGMLKAGCYEYMEPSDYGHQEGTSFPLTRHSGMAGIGAVLNHQDVFLSPSELSAFAEMFKNASSDALETKGLRIIPPDMAAHWARNFVNQYCQKPAA